VPANSEGHKVQREQHHEYCTSKLISLFNSHTRVYAHAYTVELSYNAMNGTEYFVSL
jgi:hypothetical protein